MSQTPDCPGNGDVPELSAVAAFPSEVVAYPNSSTSKSRASNLAKRKPLSPTVRFEDVGYSLPEGKCHCIRRNGRLKTILQGVSWVACVWYCDCGGQWRGCLCCLSPVHIYFALWCIIRWVFSISLIVWVLCNCLWVCRGILGPGLNAILGPTGSGKTTWVPSIDTFPVTLYIFFWLCIIYNTFNLLSWYPSCTFTLMWVLPFSYICKQSL